MKLNQLSDRQGARRPGKRIGRGIGSGTGKTSGHGHKGQKSRSGVALKGFEGGQMPIYRRLPWRGFNNPTRNRYQIVNLGRLQKAIDSGKLDPAKPINAAVLCETGIVTHPRDGVRLLAKGEIKAKLTLEVAGASKAAIAAIEKAGGKVTVLQPVKADTGKKPGESGEH
ncbi:MAG: 50S ribosomal protein L15 [Alphaproteobacteria bacterium]|nr:50S ribosomal protein L15 [Alphaproteobacteria bacterium]